MIWYESYSFNVYQRIHSIIQELEKMKHFFPNLKASLKLNKLETKRSITELVTLNMQTVMSA